MTSLTGCCCSTCGNCTKKPTYDLRTPCCCAVCGHCFKTPLTFYDYIQRQPIGGDWGRPLRPGFID